MLVWILILGLWVAVLSLILHDATKEDSEGSAVLIAVKNFNAVIVWVIKKFTNFIAWVMKKRVSKPPVKVAAAVIANSSSSTPSEPSETKAPSEPSETKPAPAAPPKKQRWRRERRVSMTKLELELAILEEVKIAAPGCEDLVGVIVGHETPKSHLDPNWVVRGVKFGNANRKIANEALAGVVERMRRELLLSDD
jgi:hypothetical protein